MLRWWWCERDMKKTMSNIIMLKAQAIRTIGSHQFFLNLFRYQVLTSTRNNYFVFCQWNTMPVHLLLSLWNQKEFIVMYIDLKTTTLSVIEYCLLNQFLNKVWRARVFKWNREGQQSRRLLMYAVCTDNGPTVLIKKATIHSFHCSLRISKINSKFVIVYAL